MSEEKKDYKDLLERIAEDNNKDLIWLLLGSIISSDTIVDIDTCTNSILMLSGLKEAILRVSENLYTKEEIDKIINFCDDGLRICQQDLDVFTNKSSEKTKE